ncbi:hypothetical protein BKA93DRAFT_150617 [Sparassis latifolia]
MSTLFSQSMRESLTSTRSAGRADLTFIPARGLTSSLTHVISCPMPADSRTSHEHQDLPKGTRELNCNHEEAVRVQRILDLGVAAGQRLTVRISCLLAVSGTSSSRYTTRRADAPRSRMCPVVREGCGRGRGFYQRKSAQNTNQYAPPHTFLPVLQVSVTSRQGLCYGVQAQYSQPLRERTEKWVDARVMMMPPVSLFEDLCVRFRRKS